MYKWILFIGLSEFELSHVEFIPPVSLVVVSSIIELHERAGASTASPFVAVVCQSAPMVAEFISRLIAYHCKSFKSKN